MISKDLIRAKGIAVGVHLCFSVAVFLVALYLILVHWYPGLLFDIDGGWQGVRIMIAVDLVLGPLLTLVIFNPKKTRRHIAFDLSVIAVFQLSALVWGFWAVNHVKPLALSYHDGMMQAVLAEDFSEQENDPADLARFGDTPVLVYTRAPQTEEEQAGVTTFAFIAELPADKLFFLFEPFTEHFSNLEFVEREQLARQFPEAKHQLNALPGHLIKYQGRYGRGVLAFDDYGNWIDSLVLEKL